MTRKEKLMLRGVPKNIRVYDNGGRSIDRYTVVFTGNFKGRDGICHYVSMSESPFHPQGFGQHGESDTIIDYPSYKHLGQKITFGKLPEDCQKAAIMDYKEIWRL